LFVLFAVMHGPQATAGQVTMRAHIGPWAE
jgi:hypothetical protein